MFGYLRFFLAFCVLVSHVGIRWYGLNPGVIAVVIFYMLAGYVVSHLWENIISGGPGKLIRFYGDRFLRIMPLYAYVALLTLGFLWATGYGSPDFDFLKIAGNFFIIPLNYYMAVDTTVLTDPQWCLIPPAWSLGAELQAYLLLPFALSRPGLKVVLTALSFTVYMLANFSVVHPDYFGYRLLAGVFFIFIAGASLKQSSLPGRKNPAGRAQKFDNYYPWVLWAAVALLGIWFIHGKMFSPAYTRETFIGILIGVPIIAVLGRVRRKLPGNAMMGALSYGLFLSHFLIIWFLDGTGLVLEESPAYLPLVTAGSVFVAWTGVRHIEQAVDRVRK